MLYFFNISTNTQKYSMLFSFDYSMPFIMRKVKKYLY